MNCKVSGICVYTCTSEMSRLADTKEHPTHRSNGEVGHLTARFPPYADIPEELVLGIRFSISGVATHSGKYGFRLGLAASMRACSISASKSAMEIPKRLVKGYKAKLRSACCMLSLLAFPIRRSLASTTDKLCFISTGKMAFQQSAEIRNPRPQWSCCY